MNKILILTDDFPPKLGGISSYCYNIARNWTDSQENVVVYTPRFDHLDKSQEPDPFKIIRKNTSFLSLMFNLPRIIKKEKIDYIHIHGTYKHLSTFIWLKKLKIVKLPLRFFLHSIDFNYLKQSKHRRKKMAKICLVADQIIVNSQFLVQEFNRYFENCQIKPKVVYPCPSAHFFAPPQTEVINKLKKQLALEGKKVIITVARMAEGKGYPHLINVLPQVLEKVPNLVWLIIGDGPKKESFIEQIQKKYLQNIIRYIGPIKHKDLAVYYHLADLFVLLTHPDQEAEEDWGTAFVEAQASGLPILAGQVGGVDEAVKHLKTGLIVDVNQPKQIINSLVDILTKPAYAKQMGVAAKAMVENDFNWENEIKKLYA